MTPPSQPGFAARTIVITGASEGIGAEFARQLAADGARLVLAARSEVRLNELAFRLRKAGAQVLIAPTDVGDPEQCQRLMQQATEHFGGIDLLINNAGVAMIGPLEEATDDVAIEALLRVNLLGTIWCTRAALPALKASRGLVVGMSSLAGKFGVPELSIYSASKFGVAGFLEALRMELDGSGVDVTIVHPGVVATGLARNALGRAPGEARRSVLDRADAMPVERCVELALAGIARREREVVMSRRARLGVRLKAWMPRLIERRLRETLAAHPPAPGKAEPAGESGK